MTERGYAITLDGLEVRMGLGIHPEELAAPQRVLIGVRMTCCYPAAVEDRIDAVLNYDAIRTGIRQMVADRHFGLQEVLCDAVADLCLADPRVAEVTVRSAKPDIYPDASVGCEVTRTRG